MNATQSQAVAKRAAIGIAINVMMLTVMFITCSLLEDGQPGYWNFGPSDHLSVLSVKIDTTERYFTLIVFIMVMQSLRTYVIETGAPIIYFNTYNIDKTVITEFTYAELYVASIAFYITTAVRDAIFVVVMIQQIDLALWIVLAGSCTTLMTVYNLLNLKTFCKPSKKRNNIEHITHN